MKKIRRIVCAMSLPAAILISTSWAVAGENFFSADEIAARLRAGSQESSRTQGYSSQDYSTQGYSSQDYTTQGLAITGGGSADRSEQRSPRQGLRIATSEPSIDLSSVTFEFNSFRLTALAERQLDELAIALFMPEFRRSNFLIAGHTDSVGNQMYNQQLSEQRARTVVDYLVYRHRVDRGQLKSVGWGESRLLTGIAPDNPANRRVEIVNLR